MVGILFRKDTNFFLNIRKGEAENFAMAGFLVPHDSQKRWGRMHCHSKKFAIFAGKTIADGVGQKDDIITTRNIRP